MKFVGWIKGELGEENKLRQYGVKGEMIYNENENCFEHCELSFWRIILIKVLRPNFYMGAFTNVSGTFQPFW